MTRDTAIRDAASGGQVDRTRFSQAFERFRRGQPKWGNEGRSLWLTLQPRTGASANSRRRSGRINCALRVSREQRRSGNSSNIGSKPSAPIPNLDFHPALGKNCSVHLETTDRSGRDFSGILTEAKWVGMRFNYPLYRLVLRPWPWIMSLRSHCRIFANMNVKDLIKEALGDNRLWPDRGPYGRGLSDAGIHGPIP